MPVHMRASVLRAALELTLQKPEAERSSVPGAYASKGKSGESAFKEPSAKRRATSKKEVKTEKSSSSSSSKIDLRAVVRAERKRHAI